ncbi:chromatin remodeling complex protein RSC6 [Sphingomonas jejuensis]|jgi:chromatin remodeling complex protein RSC6|uniref:Chromatin remodeling complex protein RSC6 n=1 Tax=Sphingomonas jejuensis TaxID=904715 RepID=A0ABX0XQG6_9SPHN|nr:SWIB/MDM2 domain-containing protein [Sphingomonas jejuensis]NJC34941.1 chromatin remodeling complex protein RSC6 [Sphingomonas jejuensis]
MAKAPSKATADKGASARGNALQQPVQPSKDLAEIVGNDPLPRSEVVKKTWDYIKKHNLQDDKDKRTINADAKLEKIFGKKSATMFEMNKHISAHLSKA